MEIQKLDKRGLDFLRGEEGCVLHPYRDKVGIPTIGIGMTYYPGTGKKVTMQDNPITQKEADDMFLTMLRPYELAVYSTTIDTITQNQFNALVSLTYNIGTNGFKGSTIQRRVNFGAGITHIKEAFLMWDKSGGKYSPELYARREREFKLYIS